MAGFTVSQIVFFVGGVLVLRTAIRFLARTIPSRAARCCIWSGVGVVMLVIAGTMLKNNPSFNNLPGANAASQARCNDAIVLGFIGIVFVMWPWINWFWDSVFGSVSAATAPIPSVQEINETLSAHYRRPATIEEVAAAQSIYAHNRNEAAAQAALGVGAFLLFRDAAKRSKG
jgi:hypothetical protein